MNLTNVYLENIIKNAILEDINYIDITTDYLMTDKFTSTAYFISKDTGVLCGIDIALKVFKFIDDNVSFSIMKKDGDKLIKGDIIASVSGKTSSLLKSERTALNLLQHMSGIATKSNKYSQLIKETSAFIVDTRKTIPGIRALQKYAVTIGGAKNHRFNLSDAAMIKDNHIDAYGSISNAVKALKDKIGHMNKIEVEVRNLEELYEALECKVDVIMLDNMDVETMKKAVKINEKSAILEASGNITLENVLQVAETGVDIISIGELTHSVKSFDISMKINKPSSKKSVRII